MTAVTTIKTHQILAYRRLFILLLACHISIAVGDTTVTPHPITETDAARFLTQATMGYSIDDVKRVQVMGYEKWLSSQLSKSPSLTEPYISYLKSRLEIDHQIRNKLLPYHKINNKKNNVGYKNTGTAWMRAILSGNDLLRQRVTWALSQILVTSTEVNALAQGISNYYDTLSNNAFYRYDEILLAVTYHPIMGRYLSYLGNKKPDFKNNITPDENYAREIMQLFTIGLWELNIDGTLKHDANGNNIPTYDNKDITELSRVFTGFHLQGEDFGKNNWGKYILPMQISKQHHDYTAKSVLDTRIRIEKGLNAQTEIALTIDALSRHPNTAPFISRQLINHLVTSNPSKAYIHRVSTVWEKSRGSLDAVIKAILLDKEARAPSKNILKTYGRLKDPVQRITNILKPLQCGKSLGYKPTDYPGLQWWHPDPYEHLHQAPMRSPSVFNFYEPGYSRPGTISKNQLYSPEFQIMTDSTAATVANYIFNGLQSGFHTTSRTNNAEPLLCNFDSLLSLSDKELKRTLNLLFAANHIDDSTMATIMKDAKSQSKNRLKQVSYAIFATVLSYDSAIQR